MDSAVAVSRPEALAMVSGDTRKAIAKLRLTLPPDAKGMETLCRHKNCAPKKEIEYG
jgi:hypothetical protein